MQVQMPNDHTLIFTAITRDESEILKAIQNLFWITQLADTHEEEIIIEDTKACYKTIGLAPNESSGDYESILQNPEKFIKWCKD